MITACWSEIRDVTINWMVLSPALIILHLLYIVCKEKNSEICTAERGLVIDRTEWFHVYSVC